MGVKAPRVPTKGRATSWCRPWRRPRENLEGGQHGPEAEGFGGVWESLPSEIRHVHRHGREKPDYGVEAGQGGVCCVHVRGRHLRLASYQGPAPFRDDDGPEEESQECRWHDNTLNQKQDPELLDWHEEQGSLDEPVDHDAEEAGSYAQSVSPADHFHPH